MAEFPALPIWTDAYMLDCGHLSDAEHGRYFLLLMLIWRSPQCRVPNEVEWIARKMRRTTEACGAEIMPLVNEFCQTTGNWITQKRLTKEFSYLQNKSMKQGAVGMQKWHGDRARQNAVNRSQRMAEARKKSTHTAQDWKILKEIFGCCVHCGTTEMNLEKDHVIPVYQGGADGIENIQPSCARCNARKGADNTDKRPFMMPEWATTFQKLAGYNPLINPKTNACQMSSTGSHFSSAPTPTPTPIKKEGEGVLKKEGKANGHGVYVKHGTVAWYAWDRHLRATTGMGARHDKRFGWFFPTEFPPTEGATQ